MIGSLRVSIVVPSFRMAGTLRTTLESLVSQTYRPLEVLVLDNCSDDGTASILREFGDQFGSVTSEPDRGQSDALKKGFARSKGEILGWLNADDLLLPDTVQQAVDAFSETDRPDVIYGHCAFLDREGQFLRYFHEIEPFSRDRLHNAIDLVAQPSAFFRREAYEAAGGVDADLVYAMDWDLWCRMAARGARFRLVDAVLSGARTYEGTKTTSGGLSRWREILSVNRTHGTNRLPLAALAHLYGDLIRPAIPWAHRPLRRLARGLFDGHLQPGSTVFGIGPGGAIGTPGFRLHYPVYRRVVAGRIRIGSETRDEPEIEARIATGERQTGRWHPGESASVCEVHWRWERPTWVDALRIEVSIGRRPGGAPWQGRLLEAHLDFVSDSETQSAEPKAAHGCG